MSKQQRIALFVLLLAGFVTIFDLFVVNVAIVNIEQTLNATLTELTLIIVGYELAFGLLLITGGRLGDIYGRRTLYRFGMFGFTLSSVLCAISPSAVLLVIARCFQGLTAALLFPQVYSSIRLNFDSSQAKKVFGLLGMTLGAAAIAGQALGGLLISLNIFGLAWRTIFLINLFIGVIALFFSRYLTQNELSDHTKLDIGGVILSTLSISFTLLPLLMLPIWHWQWFSSLFFLVGISLLILFVGFTQGMIMTPMLNLVLEKVKPELVGIASGLTATLQQIGAAIGVTSVSIILQFSLTQVISRNIIEHYKIAFSFSMLFNFIMAICAAFFLKKITNHKNTL